MDGDLEDQLAVARRRRREREALFEPALIVHVPLGERATVVFDAVAFGGGWGGDGGSQLRLVSVAREREPPLPRILGVPLARDDARAAWREVGAEPMRAIGRLGLGA